MLMIFTYQLNKEDDAVGAVAVSRLQALRVVVSIPARTNGLQ